MSFGEHVTRVCFHIAAVLIGVTWCLVLLALWKYVMA